jgi:hypothetical protein
MPIDPSAPENQSWLPHQRLVERFIPGIENASPEQLIRADGVGACPWRELRKRYDSGPDCRSCLDAVVAPPPIDDG